MFFQLRKMVLFNKIMSGFIAATFLFSMTVSPQTAQAQNVSVSVLNLPVPGTMVTATPGYMPSLIKGITIHPENPLLFDFIVNSGQDNLKGQELAVEANKMIKYFLATLTVPENELWVNLSPYEKDRIIANKLGQTAMGRDLLAQDYMLKQLTASLMYPENELGSRFWDRVYSRALTEFGTTDIPMNTFNKVWITPESVTLYEKDNSVFVVESRLKVMLEDDYLANTAGYGIESRAELDVQDGAAVSELQSQIVREILIPEITREVNEGKTFANLRQIYNAMILATWYKMNLKQSLLGQVYVDKNKILGVDVADKTVKQKIYNQYLEAFQKGIFNYMKEDYDPVTQQLIPRKYFSGGVQAKNISKAMLVLKPNDPRADRAVESILSQANVSQDYNFLTKVAELAGANSAMLAALAADGEPVVDRAASQAMLVDDVRNAAIGDLIAGASTLNPAYRRQEIDSLIEGLNAATDSRSLRDALSAAVGWLDGVHDSKEPTDISGRQHMTRIRRGILVQRDRLNGADRAQITDQERELVLQQLNDGLASNVGVPLQDVMTGTLMDETTAKAVLDDLIAQGKVEETLMEKEKKYSRARTDFSLDEIRSIFGLNELEQSVTDEYAEKEVEQTYGGMAVQEAEDLLLNLKPEQVTRINSLNADVTVAGSYLQGQFIGVQGVEIFEVSGLEAEQDRNFGVVRHLDDQGQVDRIYISSYWVNRFNSLEGQLRQLGKLALINTLSSGTVDERKRNEYMFAKENLAPEIMNNLFPVKRLSAEVMANRLLNLVIEGPIDGDKEKGALFAADVRRRIKQSVLTIALNSLNGRVDLNRRIRLSPDDPQFTAAEIADAQQRPYRAGLWAGAYAPAQDFHIFVANLEAAARGAYDDFIMLLTLVEFRKPELELTLLERIATNTEFANNYLGGIVRVSPFVEEIKSLNGEDKTPFYAKLNNMIALFLGYGFGADHANYFTYNKDGSLKIAVTQVESFPIDYKASIYRSMLRYLRDEVPDQWKSVKQMNFDADLPDRLIDDPNAVSEDELKQMLLPVIDSYGKLQIIASLLNPNHKLGGMAATRPGFHADPREAIDAKFSMDPIEGFQLVDVSSTKVRKILRDLVKGSFLASEANLTTKVHIDQLMRRPDYLMVLVAQNKGSDAVFAKSLDLLIAEHDLIVMSDERRAAILDRKESYKQKIISIIRDGLGRQDAAVDFVVEENDSTAVQVSLDGKSIARLNYSIHVELDKREKDPFRAIKNTLVINSFEATDQFSDQLTEKLIAYETVLHRARAIKTQKGVAIDDKILPIVAIDRQLRNVAEELGLFITEKEQQGNDGLRTEIFNVLRDTYTVEQAEQAYTSSPSFMALNGNEQTASLNLIKYLKKFMKRFVVLEDRYEELVAKIFDSINFPDADRAQLADLQQVKNRAGDAIGIILDTIDQNPVLAGSRDAVYRQGIDIQNSNDGEQLATVIEGIFGAISADGDYLPGFVDSMESLQAITGLEMMVYELEQDLAVATDAAQLTEDQIIELRESRDSLVEIAWSLFNLMPIGIKRFREETFPGLVQDMAKGDLQALDGLIQLLKAGQPRELNELYIDRLNQAIALSNQITELQSPADAALLSLQGLDVVTDRVGGIDLNPELLDMQIKRDGSGVPLPVWDQPIGDMSIEGFIPVIINMTPITNLPMLLGVADCADDDPDCGDETYLSFLGVADRKVKFDVDVLSAV